MAEYAIFQQSGIDTAQRVRVGVGALLPNIGHRQSRTGRLDNGGLVTLTSGMSVSVSAFQAFIQGTAASSQGGFFCVSDTAKVLTFADGGASDRIDIVVGRVYDNAYDASGQTKFAVEIVQGTPGGGVPATPASSILLAQKTITAGMSAGSGGLGTAPVDKRPPRLAAAGGIVPVLDATDRATLSNYDGNTVYRRDTDFIEYSSEGVWEQVPKVRRGTAQISMSSVASGGLVTVNVTFSSPFPAGTIPTVTVCCAGTVAGSAYAVVKSVDTISETGARIVVVNTGPSAATFSNLPLQYIAVAS